MDKYQKYFLQDTYIYCFASNSETDSSLDRTLDNGVVRIKQNEDISIKKYTLACKYPFDYFCESEWRKSSKLEEGRLWQIAEFDWDCPISKVRFLADNELVDTLEISIEYQNADAEAYYAKQEQKRKADLLATASIKCSTGAELVNIYFQPCCPDYFKTEIFLYREGQLLAKYKVDEESFFKSIGGLAYGTYSFVLKQYGNNGEIILETDDIKFNISPVLPRGRLYSNLEK